MQNVADNSRTTRARPSTEIWGYWIPEPSLLINSESRRERYLMNWLHARHGWLYILNARGSSPTRVPPQWWRNFLYNATSKHSPMATASRNAQRNAMIQHVFSGVFPDDDIDLDSRAPVAWFQYRVCDLTPNICPLIVWEMFELGFRYELLALDRYLVPDPSSETAEVIRQDLLSAVFPNKDLYALRTLPPERIGFCATLINRRIPFLEAFRRIIIRWPGCPSVVRNTVISLTVNRLEVARLEEDMITFYVRSFFDCAGRAPLVPHDYPIDLARI